MPSVDCGRYHIHELLALLKPVLGFSHSASVMIVHFEASMALRAYVAASAYFDESKPPSQR